MITHAPRRPSDRAGRRRWSGQFGLSGWPVMASGRDVGGASDGTPPGSFGPLRWRSRSLGHGGRCGDFRSGRLFDGYWRSGLVSTWGHRIAHVGVGRTGGQLCGERGPESLQQHATRARIGPSLLRDWGAGKSNRSKEGRMQPDAATRTYDNGQLSEWYSTTATGLEQGFTLNRRPAGTNGAVTIAMASAGGLTPVLTSPTSLSLFGHSGQAELNYSGLKVTDASGRVLPAHLETSGSSIRIAFNDQGATYPVRVDPFIQLASLVPPTTASAFGTVIATSSNGTTALVGDPYGGAAHRCGDRLHLRQRVMVRRHSPYSSSFDLGIRILGCPVRRRHDGPRRRPQRGCGIYRDSNGLYLQRDLMVCGNRAHACRPTPDRSAPRWRSPTTVPPRWSAIRRAARTAPAQPRYSPAADPRGRLGLALTPPNTSRAFGTSVALSSNGSTALVGDPTAGSRVLTASRTPTAQFDIVGYQHTPSCNPAMRRHSGPQSRSPAAAPRRWSAIPPVVRREPVLRRLRRSLCGAWGGSVSLALPSAPAAFGTSVSLDGAGSTALVGDPTGGSGGTGTASIYTLSGTVVRRHSPESAHRRGHVRHLGRAVLRRFHGVGRGSHRW